MIHEIDTRHGTANQHSYSNGNCLPYTGVPFAMNYFAPQTNGQNGSWWFHPEDRVFQGYRLTHQPSPWMGDFSHVVFNPVSGAFPDYSMFHCQSSYRPEEATFQPTHLKIKQLRYQITSTLIPSMYGGLLDIDYSQKQAGLFLSLPGKKNRYKFVDEYCLQLSTVNFSGAEDPDFTFYLTLHFQQPMKDLVEKETEDATLLYLNFGDITKQTVQLGTSFISLNQAELNYQRETKQMAADYLENSRDQWHTYFKRIQVEHHDPEHTKTFYHNLYRVFLFPQTFYEINETGEKIHYDTVNRSVKKGVLYTNNGFWDTYKTVYPLYSLIAKEKYEDMLEGFLTSYQETGFLPKWLSPDERGLMPGTLIDAVIADAAVKNIRLDLMEEFLEAMKKAATTQSKNPNYGRQGTLDYLKYGYVPNTYHESVNHTLDYAYSDFCISQVGKTLGDDEVEHYQKQALNYQNVFDSETGFMRPKDENDTFKPGFDAHRWGQDYAEGSAWQSSFAVYQDFAGLVQEHGGNEVFTKKLIDLCNQEPVFNVDGYGFEIHEMSEMAAIDFGQLAISNQPSFHYPYLFSYVGKPEMAQPLIKQLLTECFDTTSQGYPGDEDNGSMAAWYIFNSLGFYPVTPGSGEYVIGIPLVKKAVLHLSNDETLVIQANTNRSQHQFVHNIKRNDDHYTALYFKHADLLKGGQINFELGIVPNPKTYQKEEYPFSLSN